MNEPSPGAPIHRVREVLDRALEHPSEERAQFVAAACGSDGGLREEVLSLLKALALGGEMLEPEAPPDEAPAEPLTGLQFGAYRVGTRIGAGGMGVVYEAIDTRLGRTVAVKALPPRLARDPHRRARFEREARVVAALNHPNIASIYGVEETPMGTVLVLEYVPGPNLAELLVGKALPLEEAVDIARQIARALEAAHGAGIVHRDLKPANIKVTPEGMVKVLDFGIAKVVSGAAEVAGAEDGQTLAGAMIGTAAYMSPEQARGRPVDRRTDLWSFGCVLYEMLTGHRAFEGDTTSDTVAAVLRSEPDWSRLPNQTPQGVHRVLLRCLSKDPQQRLRDAGDAALDLHVDAELPEALAPAGRRWWLALVVGLAVAISLAGGWFSRGVGQRELEPMRFSIHSSQPISSSYNGSVAFSPDGRVVVYAAGDPWNTAGLYARPLNTFGSELMPGTERASMPFFSSDGKWIGFLEGNADGVGPAVLRKVPAQGGPVQVIMQRAETVIGADWGDDGSLVLCQFPGTVWHLAPDEAAPSRIGPQLDVERELFSHPDVLPGSRQALITHWTRDDGVDWKPHIVVMDLRTGHRKELLAGCAQARYVSERAAVVYLQGSSIMAQPFDAESVQLSGEARRLIEPEGDVGSGTFVRYAVSSTGSLAYVPGDAPAPSTELAWFSVDGSSSTVYRSRFPIWTLRLSPDESKVAFTTHVPERDLWVLDLHRGTTIRLTTSGGTSYPVWTPDGTRIAFEHQHGGKAEILWTRSDGSGQPERLYAHPDGTGCFPTGFSPDGATLVISTLDANGKDTDIYLVPIGGEGSVQKLLPTKADRVAARFSPDGTMIAFSSTETGRAEIYAMPYPALDRKVRVSHEGGERPTWSGDSKRLFYRYAQRLYATDVASSPTLTISAPVVLLDVLPGDRYDTSIDGTRFIMGRPKGEWRPQTTIHVITGLLQSSDK